MMHIAQFQPATGASQRSGHITPPAFFGILLGMALSFAIWGAVGLVVL